MNLSTPPLILLLLLTTPALADNYLDDRSSPESLIRSLYNAINHHEYARAWSYYGEAPTKDFATYAKGFEETQHVDVLIGDVAGDGAAGSIFFNVPTAIRATNGKSQESYFAGCYVLRQINSTVQEPPFTPLMIQSAKLKPIKQDDFTRYGLPKCGDPANDTGSGTNVALSTTDAAKAKFASDMQGRCDKVGETLSGINEPETFPLILKHEDDNEVSTQILFAFSCAMAAYNESNVFYLDDGVEGLRRLSFAEPSYAYKYYDTESAKLKSMKFMGFDSTDILTNASFDPKTNTFSSFAKWRGIGDASSGGTWRITDRAILLTDYEIDPTFDGEQNPVTVVKNGRLVQKP